MIIRTKETCRKCKNTYGKIKAGELIHSCPNCGTLIRPVKFEILLELMKLADKEKRTGCIPLNGYGEVCVTQ